MEARLSLKVRILTEEASNDLFGFQERIVGNSRALPHYVAGLSLQPVISLLLFVRAKDEDLKKFAGQTLPTLKSHLELAESTNGKVKSAK